MTFLIGRSIGPAASKRSLFTAPIKFQLIKDASKVNLLEPAKKEMSKKLLSSDAKKGKQSVNKALFLKGIIPKPNLKLFSNQENPSFVSVNISLQGITYTKLDKDRNLLDSAILPGMDNPTSLVAFQHQKLAKITSEVVDKLPVADYYLFEELPQILAKDPYVKHKVNLTKLWTTLVTNLMMVKPEATVGIHTIRPNVIDTLFELRVGNERISIQDCLQKIISQKHLLQDENPFSINMPKDAFNEYNSQGKEYLSGCLLNVLAFNYLCHEAMKK